MNLKKPYAEDIEWCTRVQEECECDNCDGCPNNMLILTTHEENLYECKFVHEITIDNILPVTVNGSNTLAKTHQCIELAQFIDHFGLKKSGYMPEAMKQHPLFFMLKKTLSLGIPLKIYAAKDKVMVAIYKNAVYLIAPRIESE